MTTTTEPHATFETPPEEMIGVKPPPGPHPLTQRRIWLPLAILLFVLNIPFIHLLTRGPAATTTTVPFHDDYSRDELGPNYFSTGGQWRIVDGQVYSPGVKNNPLWLKAKLPHDFVIEFDVRSESADGDVKAEVLGNGRDHSSGYILLFGGWKNTISAIARLDEHGTDRQDRRDKKVEKGRTYHWKIVRDGTALSWFVDGELFKKFDDPNPLEGSNHDRFGFGTWATDAYFDNLSIQPLR